VFWKKKIRITGWKNAQITNGLTNLYWSIYHWITLQLILCFRLFIVSRFPTALWEISKLKMTVEDRRCVYVCMCSGSHVGVQHSRVNTEEQRRRGNSAGNLQQHGGTSLLAGKPRRSQGNGCCLAQLYTYWRHSDIRLFSLWRSKSFLLLAISF